MKSKTNWKKLKAMTEKEVIAAAKADPDALPLSVKDLKAFKAVQPASKLPKKNLTQQK